MGLPLTITLAFNLPTDPTSWTLVAAVLATGYVYLKSKKPRRRDPMQTSPFSSLSVQRKVESQMTDLLVELEKMARQMNAQLDTRAAKLEELLRQADERLAMLDEKLADIRRAEGDPIPLPPPTRRSASLPPLTPDVEDPPPAPLPIDPRHATVYRLADEGRTPLEISREVNQPPGEVELILALRRRAR